MSKSTETTNDRVPRVLVRFGKHPSSVWKPHRVWGNTHRAWGNTHQLWGNTHRAWGNIHRAWGNTRESCGNVGRTEALPKAKWRGCTEALLGSTEALLGSTEACGTLGTRGRGAWGGAIGRIVGRCRG